MRHIKLILIVIILVIVVSTLERLNNWLGYLALFIATVFIRKLEDKWLK
ncbi:hypothetical protein DSOL_4948 [Desulfosporosinus metallidurans]|uniref:Uncharacterized protein n=1 Tax=Desulfosporosinus metallidurans TaxID=1888891 RepID=A0A1Q8QGP5_9FIRM|nr:hypothetical protein DSOL_4948 [Desulfosporosinus metallidurans]